MEGSWREGHVSISIRWIATVWSPTISVFFPRTNQFSMAAASASTPAPCRTKLIRKWGSLGEPLFRVDCTPPNGNGLLPPPFSNLCICSFSFPWATHGISWEDHGIARRGIDLFRRKHYASLPIDPTLPRTLFSSIEESLVDRFLVGSREINSGEGGSSVKGRFFGNWFSSVGLGDCFGFGRKFRGEREKFLCWFRFRECFLSQTDRKIWFQDFVFEYGIRSNILFKSNGG